MADFLDTAHRLWKTGQVQDAEGDFSRVFSAVSALQAVHSKATLDTNNVESLFATLEMAAMLRKFPDSGSPDVDAIVESLKVVIGTTLERTIDIPWSHGGPHPPAPYGQFVKLLRHLREDARPARTVSVITFNYDLACDFAFHNGRIPVNYGLDDFVHPNGVFLLKLHGSLNWVYCPDLDRVVPWTMQEHFETHRWNVFGNDARVVRLQLMPQLKDYKYQDHEVVPKPVLVPPTWNKAEYHKNLSDVWSRAAQELTNAEDIFIAGYSLPETDAFFRYMYALGTEGSVPLKRLWVFNPDTTVATRFSSMLGPGAASRFRFFDDTFEAALSTISSELPGRS
jgi:hypothetical protein